MSFKPVKLIKVTMPHWIGQSLNTISVCIDQRKIYPVVFPRGKKTFPNKRTLAVNIHTMEYIPSTATTQNLSALKQFNSQVFYGYRLDVTIVTPREPELYKGSLELAIARVVNVRS